MHLTHQASPESRTTTTVATATKTPTAISQTLRQNASVVSPASVSTVVQQGLADAGGTTPTSSKKPPLKVIIPERGGVRNIQVSMRGMYA